MDMPTSFKNHIDTQIDTLLFNNPSLKKYAEFNPFPETSSDYNLQNRKLPKNNTDNVSNYYNHYNYDMAKTLPLSIYDTLNYRELDNNSKLHMLNILGLIYDNYLEFLPPKLKEPDEKDFFIKKKEIIDEDNYIYNINVRMNLILKTIIIKINNIIDYMTIKYL